MTYEEIITSLKAAQKELDKLVAWAKSETPPIPYKENLDNVRQGNRIKVVWQGKTFYYPSIREASRYINIPESSIRGHLKKHPSYYRDGCLISYDSLKLP